MPSFSRVMSISMSTGSWKKLGHFSASRRGEGGEGGRAAAVRFSCAGAIKAAGWAQPATGTCQAGPQSQLGRPDSQSRSPCALPQGTRGYSSVGVSQPQA